MCPVQGCDSIFKYVTTASFQIFHAPRCCPWWRSRFKVYHLNPTFEMASLNKQTNTVLSISAKRHASSSKYITFIASDRHRNVPPALPLQTLHLLRRLYRWRRNLWSTTGPMLKAPYNSFRPLCLSNNSRRTYMLTWAGDWKRSKYLLVIPFYDLFYR